MCGIAGVITSGSHQILQEDNWRTFVEPLKYRGPDDNGVWHHQVGQTKVSLFHTRLSIIDLSAAGRQPLHSDSGNSSIVYNGEIYNYLTLRNELLERGFVFRTQSDTEVIVNAFECWGIQVALSKIDGMFAFALFSRKDNSLILARDRFGKKPLYYFIGDGYLVFSSDIRSFSKIEGLSHTIDEHALGYFFSELSTPHEATIWKDIKKVLPASYLCFTNSGISEYKDYWNLEYSEDNKLSIDEVCSKTEYLLSQAVKKRLVADVRVSALLSGGIDSSLIVAKMTEHSSTRVRTYSVGFNEFSFNELPYARQVANQFGTDHTELVITHQELGSINNLILEFGEPFADSSMIPTYLMAKEISKTEKVVLGGDGGDELFAGYESYHFARKFDLVKRFRAFYPMAKLLQRMCPSYQTNLLERLLSQARRPAYHLLDRNLGFTEGELPYLFSNELFFSALKSEHSFIWNKYSPRSSSDLINVMSASLKTRLLNDYLVKVDRASMYASLEMRSPFLDKDLAEFAATLNGDQLVGKTGNKAILKSVAEKYFPTGFVHREKQGFQIPIGDWFKGKLSPVLLETVLGGKQKLLDLNYTYIENILRQHIQGERDHSHRVWSLYVFHVWAQQL